MAKRPEAKYCSEKCRSRSETIARQRKLEEGRIIESKLCLICGNQFTPHVRNIHQIYCSPKCLSKAMNTRAVSSGRKKEQYYKHKAQYASLKSKTDLAYKDEIRFSGNKKHVLERDSHKCTDCGKTKGLIIHHKDGSGKSNNPNNEIDNLITLCRPCHSNHHSGENNHAFIHLSKEQILEARRSSSSWEETAKKLSVTRQTLIKRRKMLEIF